MDRVRLMKIELGAGIWWLWFETLVVTFKVFHMEI